MDLSSLIWGIAWCVLAVIVYVMLKKRIDDGEDTYFNVRSAILCVLLLVIGIVMILKELAKII